MQPTELVAIMAAIIYSGRREGEGPGRKPARRRSRKPGTCGTSRWTNGAIRAPAAWRATRWRPDAASRRRVGNEWGAGATSRAD